MHAGDIQPCDWLEPPYPFPLPLNTTYIKAAPPAIMPVPSMSIGWPQQKADFSQIPPSGINATEYKSFPNMFDPCLRD